MDMAKKEPVQKDEIWLFHLYVAGQTPRSIAAYDNLRTICEEHLKDRYEIVVIDLEEKPELASSDQIIAIPTVIRKLPSPVRKMIGDLSNRDKVMITLNLKRI